MLVTRADPADATASPISAAASLPPPGESDDAALRADAAAATAELERIFEAGPIPMGEPAFVALSQTLPRLLANAWLALVRHPDEFARLRAHPDCCRGRSTNCCATRESCAASSGGPPRTSIWAA